MFGNFRAWLIRYILAAAYESRVFVRAELPVYSSDVRTEAAQTGRAPGDDMESDMSKTLCFHVPSTQLSDIDSS